ncbi:thioredoxin-like 3-2, chloroplastic isoform X1 [Iris pallida]|uniref:Thioredoxin-like 3-2, chloroplastic isoform X1 n=1 Tax=Iris pallida TaxID=29817 RepID=A0AAX6EHH7_IRIPA|nr:thioredoxin-like 3-2, chloroplastic isoform X1 [Iris pallida]
MTAALLSPSVRLFSRASRRIPLSSRPHQTLTLITFPSSSSVPTVSRKLIAQSAARSGVEKASSEDELVGADDAGGGRRGGAGGEEPTSIELVPIASEEQFNRVVAEAQQLEESIVILWMANWCRKCIYLKPKLEKLAVDYYPRIRFYCVDVNSVPQKLVNRAGVTLRLTNVNCTWDVKTEQKMPTIQLWRDSQKQAEVLGGHKAWLVIDDIRRMIEDDE